MRVLIRTGASIRLGNGHVVRMMAFAQFLRSRGVPVLIALTEGDSWEEDLIRRGFDVLRPPVATVGEGMIDFIRNNRITHFIYDSRNDLSISDMIAIKTATSVRIVVIDSPEEIRLTAHVNIYPPIPQIKNWDWTGFSGSNFSGWDYVLLRDEFKGPCATGRSGKILLSFGATDPLELTESFLRLIHQHSVLFTGYTFVLPVGSQFARMSAIERSAPFLALPIEVLRSPSNIAEVFASVEFAIIAFGVTAYELASLGVPFLYVPISEDHAASAQVFAKSGFGRSLGPPSDLDDNFESTIRGFLTHRPHPPSIRIGDWEKIFQAIS